jgi:hypothetical protein
MKKLTVLLLTLIPLLQVSALQTYDPGDLVNAIKRGQVLTELYLNRWNIMENSLSIEELKQMNYQEKYYHVSRGGYSKTLDVYFHGEDILKYPINTPFGKYNLDLFRIFGSTIVRFDELADLGLLKWGFAFSAAGYRYGMVKNTKLNDSSSISGTPALGQQQVTDYLYSQIFDDLLVLTNIFKPFGYIHVGILLNQQIDPGPDGMLNTADDREEKSGSRVFLDSNLFGFLFVNMGYNTANDKAESLSTRMELFSLLAIPGWTAPRSKYPDLYLGYSYINPSSSLTGKENFTAESYKSKMTAFAELFYNYYDALFFKAKTEVFLKGRTSNESGYIGKQFYGELGFRLDAFTVMSDPEAYYKANTDEETTFLSYYIILGMSYLIDGRLRDFGNPRSETAGFTGGLQMNIGTSSLGGTLEIKGSYNYSPKLYNLIEAYDHWIFELSLQIGF